MSKVVGTYRDPKLWRGPIPGTHEPGFVESPLWEDEGAREVLRNLLPSARAFTMGECRILVGQERGGVHGELRWHLTISCADRHPSWDEIKVARYRLLPPGIAVAMVLPPPLHYVNVAAQDHVFQLWEIKDEARVWETG